MTLHARQRTVARSVKCTGLGVHSGKTVNMTIRPAPANHGIKFVRTDLPGSPEIPAHFNRVVDTSLATVIGYNGCIVSTIEHLMASFAGLSIDNALVELDAYEVPIMDGSAGPFTEAIRSTGIREQDSPRCFFMINSPIELSDGNRSVAIYPDRTFRITCTIDFNHPLVGEQTITVELNDDLFDAEISRARTFGFFHEVEYLKRYGFARGGSLENAVVLTADGVMNESGLRFADEFVRHKLLDCIGDFSLLGMPMMGHIVTYRSGHAFNHAFLEKFFASKTAWETRTLHADAARRPDRSARPRRSTPQPGVFL